MSRRNMSERVNCGLMLCQGIPPLGSPPPTKLVGIRDSISDQEDRNLAVLNNLVPGGVADQNEFRPLAKLLQDIGQSNKYGITPIDTFQLSPESVKLLQDFMDKAGVPRTGESPKRAEVLNTMQKTFGLSDTQVSGLLANLSTGQDALGGKDRFERLPGNNISPKNQSLRLWEGQKA
jgi:hypothetical protein